MRSRHPLFGLALAAFGALALTPDTLLMRISGMSGVQMMGWRGTLMGVVMLATWAVLHRGHLRADIRALATISGLGVALSQAVNGAFFAIGIAIAPVTVVLLGVATVPVFAAVFSRLMLGEPTSRATWATIAAVLAGIALAILGKPDASAPWDVASLLGGAMGLGVAACLAFSFVLIRRAGGLPILPAVGTGALMAGLVGVAITGPAQMGQGAVWAIAITGVVILPVGFFALSLASRHTAAANVSLLMLLETVLGPLWVWLGYGEAPTPLMLVGGAIVIGSLALYLLRQRRGA
ncbi:DMT family transporter [Maritalea mobilis]|uniref:DMT family transporter n=1 Tax=Maritalea mobilis TaxID=483324 RepID=UPI001C977B4B|nr:DMT family transporter [Maritalea mobilis]MBY6201910.1 DMT family transporter [Maritalea mobilis]